MLRRGMLRWCSASTTSAAAAAAAKTTTMTDKTAFMQLVKTLRYRTEAPIIDCTAALREANLDMDAAVAVLQRRGAARALRRGDRVTGHGFVVRCVANNSNSSNTHAQLCSPAAAIVTVCSETDFAARSDTFQSMCLRVRDAMCSLLEQEQHQQALLSSSGDAAAVAAALTQTLSTTCASTLQSAIAVLGENVRIGAVHLLPPPPPPPAVSGDAMALRVGSYVHGGVVADNGVGRYVGLVAVRPLAASSQSHNDTTATTAPTTTTTSHATAVDEAVIDEAALTALARHLVATCGADEDSAAAAATDEADDGFTAAEFFGSATADARETVAQWLQRHRVQFCGSVVVEFGKEPVMHRAAAVTARTS